MKTQILWKFALFSGLLLFNTALATHLLSIFEINARTDSAKNALIARAHAETTPIQFNPPPLKPLQRPTSHSPAAKENLPTTNSSNTVRNKPIYLVYSDANSQLLSRLYMHFEHDSTALSEELAQSLEAVLRRTDLSAINSVRIAAPMPPNAQEIQRQAIRLRTRALAEAIYPYLQSISIVYPGTDSDANRLVLEFSNPVPVRKTSHPAHPAS